MKKPNFKLNLSIYKVLVLGYLALIFLGSVLLILPFATSKGEHTSYLNALFVSVSATCVTGLVPYDTATHWSLFGQLVILIMIQIGGLGFMTIVSILYDILGKNLNLYQRKMLMQTSGANKLTGVRSLVRRIVVGTLIAESLGAALLSIRFIPQFGAAKGIYFAIWHSVSAFCNAGFDLMGGTFGKFSSLTNYATDPLVLLTLSLLIMSGGIGFCVWNDVIENKFRFKKLKLHTQVVIIVNTLLLIVSTLLLFGFERHSEAVTEYNTGEQFLIAFFNAVTPRTAGFNIIDVSKMSESGRFLTVILMFIGGSSASTAGGIKISTVTVIIMGMFTVFRGKKDIVIGKKRLDESLLNQALAISASCFLLVAISTLIICAVETNHAVTFESALFETVSALGTVGLSMSLTPTLSAASKCIIMILMYAGRVGILTLALALGEHKKSVGAKRPLDNMLIG